jgi:enoyl-CoA hydratase
MTASVALTVQASGQLATVTLSNPGKQNAISVAMWQELRRVFLALQFEPGLRCIVLRGADGHFAAGADISEFAGFRFEEPSLRHYHEQIIAPALDAIWQCDVPIIAAIEGSCVGGGLEIAACCDLRIATSDASFGAPIAKLGFAMAPLELHAVVRAVGFANARELLLFGGLWTAQQALDRGLLAAVVNATELIADIDNRKSQVLKLSAQSLRLNKQTLRAFSQAQLPPSTALALSADAATFAYAATADHREGIAAFLAKRAPKFS